MENNKKTLKKKKHNTKQYKYIQTKNNQQKLTKVNIKQHKIKYQY